MKSFVLSENVFDLKNLKNYESIMCRGNGYMCIRASLEEEYIGEQRNTLINGVFNAPQGEVSEIAVLPDSVNCEITIDGERFDMLKGSCEDYCRTLDMETGEGIRSLVWVSPKGDRIKLEFRNTVSLVKKHISALKVSITPLDNNADIEIKSGINGKTTNTGVQHFSAPQRRVYGDGMMGMLVKTLQSGVDVALHCKCSCTASYTERYTTDRRSVYSNIAFKAKKNEAVQYEKITSYATSRDCEYNATTDTLSVQNDGMRYLNEALALGYNELYRENVAAWAAYWEMTPAKIVGNEFENKALKFAMYHLNIMANKEDNRVGIGAKGLSGEGYKGHSFWDTEIFILPYYIYTAPDTARNLLIYRYKLLKSAMDKAKKYGYEGAMYPWEGAWLDDGEACPEYGDLDLMTGELRRNMMGEIEVHISADIAYAVWQYYKATLDKEFMESYGYEIILTTAWFWTSRVTHKNGRYEILHVIGPDEYKDDIDNNAYTNYMAYHNLKLALEIRNNLPQSLKDRYDTESIYKKIEDVTGEIYLPKADSDGIIPAFDGYRELEEIDTAKYKNLDKVGTIFKDYGFAKIQEMQVGKQADTIMLFQLLRDMFSDEEIKRNYEFYEYRTLHDSSLSMCFHALVSARCGLTDEAEVMFEKACSVDIGENVNNSDEGIHSASIGGIWQALVMGFGGLRIEDDKLSVSPILPKGWKSYEFTVFYRGAKLCIRTDENGSEVIRLNGENVKILLNGKEI